MHPDWARGLRDQCQAAGVPFFFKQWGEWVPASRREVIEAPFTKRVYLDGQALLRVGKKEAGRNLDGRTWDEFPSPEVVDA